MINDKQSLGAWGEQYARGYLERQGITIIASNVRTPYGEIDLVGRDAAGLVFIEVKTRSSRMYGNPEDAIHARKRAHLEQSALHYIQNHPEEEATWRIDVISIFRNRSGQAPVEVEWFRNAVQ